MLKPFRRHLASCRFKSRKQRNCACPIHVEGKLNGVMVRKSLDLASWQAAQQRVREWESEGLPDIVSVDDACNRFDREGITNNLKPSTMRKLRQFNGDLRHYCIIKNYEFISQLGTAEVFDFRNSWKDAPTTALKKLERMKAFFNFCIRQGWLKENPAKGLKPPIITTPPKEPFTREEFKKILAACDQYPVKGIYGCDNRTRMRAMTLLLYYTGLRIGDAVGLEKSRIDTDSFLNIRTEKTGTDVSVPLEPEVIKALSELKNNGKYFFWSGHGSLKSAVSDWQRSFRKLFEIADVKGHPHKFRHSAAQNWRLSGTPPEYVAAMLGHKSTRIVEKYYSAWDKTRREDLIKYVKKSWEVSNRFLAEEEEKGTAL